MGVGRALCIWLQQVIVRRWDQQEERLVKVPEEEVCNYFSCEFDPFFCSFLAQMHNIGRKEDPCFANWHEMELTWDLEQA